MKKHIVGADSQWRILHDFEHKQKESFLKELTKTKATEMFKYFYQFARKIGDKDYYNKLNYKKVAALSKIHYMFMRVKP